MSSIVPYLLVLGAAAGAAAASIPSDWSQCEARMDGHLLYYVPEGFKFSGNVRRYYIASELVTWDYAPSGWAKKSPFHSSFSYSTALVDSCRNFSGWDNWLGVPLNESFRAQKLGIYCFRHEPWNTIR